MTEESSVSTRSVGVKWGVISGLVGIILFLILDFTGQTNGPLRWIGIVFSIVLIYLAHKEYKDEGDTYMSYGQGVGIGLWMSIVSAGISSVFTYIYIKFINTSYTDFIREEQIRAMEEQGMSDSEIDQAMEIAGAFTTPEAIFGLGLIMGVIFGLIIALIVSAITKKDKPELV